MTKTRLVLAGAICFLLALPTAAPAQPRHGHGHDRAQPLVIGHRGASGYRPEHTLASHRGRRAAAVRHTNVNCAG